MTKIANQIWQAWNRFWFKPSSAVPIALYRIMFGLLVLTNLALLLPDIDVWYGKNAVISIETAKQWPFELMLDPLLLLPQTDQSLRLFFSIFATAAVGLTLGLCTRFSAALVFLGLVSLHHRDWVMINSGDIFMRLAALYLCFSSAGKALSLDRIVEVWTAKDFKSGAPANSPVWVQRLFQIQLAMLYCQAFWTKIIGPPWLDGTALYYVTRLEDYRRFPLPGFLNNFVALKLLTWFTLATEFSLWTLIWIKPARYIVLLLGILLHAGIDLYMNLPLFEYLMITVYILFVDPEDLARIMEVLRKAVHARFGPPVLAIYNGADANSARLAETLRRLDVFRMVDLVDYSLCEKEWAGFAPAERCSKDGWLCVFTSASQTWSSGAQANRTILRMIPWAVPMLLMAARKSA